MRKTGVVRGVAGAVIGSLLVMAVASCAGTPGAAARHGQASPRSTQRAGRAGHPGAPAGFRQIPGVGPRLQQRIPAGSRQVVAVYGKGLNAAEATVALFTRQAGGWHKVRTWPAHNGKKGWTTDHHEGDKRSPVGVFTLSDAGGVLPAPASDPGAALPYTESPSFQAPAYWGKAYRHDFDYVIAIDYNRVPGTSPMDPTRPEGQAKGGSIWLHRDHGSGTSACVTLSKAGMAYLLRTLDPLQHPAIVMGDRADLMS